MVHIANTCPLTVHICYERHAGVRHERAYRYRQTDPTEHGLDPTLVQSNEELSCADKRPARVLWSTVHRRYIARAKLTPLPTVTA